MSIGQVTFSSAVHIAKCIWYPIFSNELTAAFYLAPSELHQLLWLPCGGVQRWLRKNLGEEPLKSFCKAVLICINKLPLPISKGLSTPEQHFKVSGLLSSLSSTLHSWQLSILWGVQGQQSAQDFTVPARISIITSTDGIIITTEVTVRSFWSKETSSCFISKAFLLAIET